MTEGKFTFHNPTQIHFGCGVLDDIGLHVKGARVVLVTSAGFTRRGVVDRLKMLLGESLLGVFDAVTSNPTFDSVKDAYTGLKKYDYDFVIGLGGGSVLDTAKIVSAMDAAGGEDWLDDRLRNGAPFPVPFNPKPVITVPTSAGSGSEVTMWSSVWDMNEKKKYSVSHQALYPAKTVIDPELAVTLDKRQTVYSGLDALSHAVEAVWNKNCNPVSDTLAMGAIGTIYRNLPLLKDDLSNVELRTIMAEASLKAGLAFSNTQTAMAHAISYPLTSMFNIPHGLACALPLPGLVEFNAGGSSDFLGKLADSFGVEGSPRKIREVIEMLFKKLGVRGELSVYGVGARDVKRVCGAVLKADRFKNNVAEISEDSLEVLIGSML